MRDDRRIHVLLLVASQVVLFVCIQQLNVAHAIYTTARTVFRLVPGDDEFECRWACKGYDGNQYAFDYYSFFGGHCFCKSDEDWPIQPESLLSEERANFEFDYMGQFECQEFEFENQDLNILYNRVCQCIRKKEPLTWFEAVDFAIASNLLRDNFGGIAQHLPQTNHQLNDYVIGQLNDVYAMIENPDGDYASSNLDYTRLTKMFLLSVDIDHYNQSPLIADAFDDLVTSIGLLEAHSALEALNQFNGQIHLTEIQADPDSTPLPPWDSSRYRDASRMARKLQEYIAEHERLANRWKLDDKFKGLVTGSETFLELKKLEIIYSRMRQVYHDNRG